MRVAQNDKENYRCPHVLRRNPAFTLNELLITANDTRRLPALHRLEQAYTGGARLKLAALALGVAGYWAVSLAAGAPLFVFPAVALCGAAYLVLPGLLFARWLCARRRGGAFPAALLWPVALLCGACFLCLCYLPAVRLWRPLLQLLPLPVAALSLWREGRRVAERRGAACPAAGAAPDVLCLAAMLGLLLAACAFAMAATGALPSAVGPTVVHQDVLWNVGNAASLKNNFPPWDIRFIGIRLRYHFFTDLLCAIFSMLTGQSCYAVAVFGMQPLMLAGTLCCLRGMGLVFFGGSHRRALALCGALFAAASASLWWPLLHSGHPFGNSFIEHLLTNINAQTTTTLLFGLFFGLFCGAAQKGFAAGLWHTALMLAAFLLLCAAKGPAASIVLCAALMALLAAGISGKNWRALALAGALAALFAAVYALLYAGSAESHLLVEPQGTLLQGALGGLVRPLVGGGAAALWAACLPLWLAQTFLMLPAPVLVAAASFFGEARRFFRLPAPALLCYFAAGGGMLAFFLFNQQSFSQVYFFFVAAPAMILLALRALPMRDKAAEEQKPLGFIRRPRAFRRLAAALAALGLFTALCTYAGFVLRGAQVLARGAAPDADPAAVLTLADEEAAAWLRAHTPRGTVFATNRIHSGEGFAGVANTYSALAERQAHMEGYRYSAGFGSVPWTMLESHVAANAALFSPDTPRAEILRIAGERGISYLVYHAASEGSNAQLQGFEKVYDGDGTIIYRIAVS